MRGVFWSLTVVLWIAAVFFAAAATTSFVRAPEYARREQNIRDQLIRRASFVDEILQRDKRLPSNEEFQQQSERIGDGGHLIYLEPSRPSEAFDFPQWPSEGSHYAIKVWRGEWFSYYDSNTGKTSLDSATDIWTWRLDALVPLGFAVLLATPSITVLLLRAKKRPNQALEPTTLAVTPCAPSSTSRASQGRGSS